MTMKIGILTTAALASLAIVCTASADTFRINKGKVIVVCPLTVGGSFEARTAAVEGEVTSGTGGVLDGRIAVDLASLETGIALRDRHLKENYLEIGKQDGFDRAVLEQIQIRSVMALADQPFSGLLTLHGEQLPVNGTISIRDDHGKWRAEAEFPVRLARFRIQTPQYLGVGVTDEVRVRIQFDILRSASQLAGARR